jgi:hypothetical protein
VVAIASKFKHAILAGGVVAGLVCAGVTLGPAQGAENTKVPDFAPDANTGWLAQDDEFIPPPSGPGPIRSDPAHPYVSFYKFPTNPRPSFRVADLTNPILHPPAARLSGKIAIAPGDGASSWWSPAGHAAAPRQHGSG